MSQSPHNLLGTKTTPPTSNLVSFSWWRGSWWTWWWWERRQNPFGPIPTHPLKVCSTCVPIFETVTKALTWTTPCTILGFVLFSNSFFPVPPSQVWLGHPGDSFLSPPPSLMRTGSSFSISTFYRNLGNWPLLLLQPLCLTLEHLKDCFSLIKARLIKLSNIDPLLLVTTGWVRGCLSGPDGIWGLGMCD